MAPNRRPKCGATIGRPIEETGIQ